MAAHGGRAERPDEVRAAGRPPVLGVDVGGVIIDRVAEDHDTSFFGETPMRTPAVEGAFEAIAVLAADPFQGRVHLVSKAKLATADRTRRWLSLHAFTGRTGVPETNLHFVLERADKAPVCRRLGITDFVDDRLDVLRHLGTVPGRYLFTGGGGDAEAPDELPEWAERAATWPELIAAIRRSVARR
ncbi:hypothetical protein [Streptomonospora litoralis]|uniref:Uncharacterized protein n=1 Tax=Streptomonospora litoralis TaxID=2498135 RepID=A0A4P6PVP5_9ACTN|nr:hypothetical protein [Streptomonospora litoralis]QBI52153.1 hypothetical protein EKD16_01680 [Streptomonospora litoralis]